MANFAKFSFFDKDLGWKKIAEELKKIKGSYVKVGVLSDTATYPNSKANLADVATFNEFGTEHIPSRPFMRQAFDKNMEEMKKFVEVRYGLVVDGKLDVNRALNEVGVFFKGKVQAIFREGDFAPNAPSTIAKKNHVKIAAATSTLNSARKKTEKGKELTEKEFQRVLGAKETLAGGGTTPLIDTGRLRQSIHYQVVIE